MPAPSSPTDRDPKEQRPMAPGDQAPAGTKGTGEDVCPRCGGSGRLASGTCPECAGSGKVIKGVGGG